MAVPIKSLLLLCIVEIVYAQYPDLDIGGQRGPTLRTSTRFFPRPAGKPNVPSSSGPSHRLKRPIALKVRPSTEANEITPFLLGRPKPTFLPIIKAENPTPPPQLLQRDQPIKPVSEEAKEEEEDFNRPPLPIKPLHSVVIPQQQVFPQLGNNFFSSPLTPRPEPVFQFRPAPAFTQPVQPPPPHTDRVENIPPVQYRPQKPVKLRKPIDDDDEVHIPVKQHYQQSSVSKQSLKKGGYREKKPVAQIIRRWREDNDDGSITWGYENDDGSYKEEIIGVDCVTRGKYGYVDLDGVKREYSYEMGIKCDEQELEEDSGFVDYQENKLVLPNGKTIDLSNMGKKQARRPQPLYRN